ncbi:hypothetical protein QBC34DRAFT_487409 [Podospora aff. communis PSN243]|uniref:Peptidase S8/S53 domain-containing protein n=1 Tax=Podospora aff. communis PSN243 TaxID=3040156 RepID=A0AAV9G8S3_9PEZI|nr:hypothetical protein QBC34DRAFT_487409 [Podospora aff. communis PSN243]
MFSFAGALWKALHRSDNPAPEPSAPDKCPSLLQLAHQTFPWLSIQITNIANEKTKPKLGELGSHLCSRLERDVNFTRLLVELESILSDRRGLDKLRRKNDDHFPRLRALADTLENAEVDAAKRQQDVEKALRARLKKIKYSIVFTAFAELSKIVEEDDDVLDVISSQPSRLGKDDFVGYEKYATAVQKALTKYSSCSCSPSDQEKGEAGDSNHWARLRLKPLYRVNEQNQIPFDMVFSASPNPTRTRQFEWQPVHILVSAAESSRRVQFEQKSAVVKTRDQPSSSNTDIGGYESIDNLCTLLSSRCDSLLCLKVAKDRLLVLREVTQLVSSHTVQHDASPGLPLGQVLDRFGMRYGMRPVLAYILAKAVWYYYDSDWMSMGMTNDSVYFMGETQEDDVTYFCKPYLSLPPDGKRQVEYRHVTGMLHRYPRVLALGIMLVEIATGRHLATEGHPDHWDAKTVNNKLLRLQEQVNSDEFHEDCRFPRYKDAVRKCLDPLLFQNAAFNPQKPTENLSRRRQILYDGVVDPLRQLVEGTGWDNELEDMEKTALVPKPRAQPPSTNSVRAGASEMPNPKSSSHVDEWLDNLAALALTVRRKKGRGGGTPVKIAILDTGYDQSTPTFESPRSSYRIKGWKDFVSGSPTPVDADGHGTHLLTLMLRLECPAHIYVGRVTESSKTMMSAESSIAEAIRVAATEWDVDFVSLSFGFSRHVPAIHEAITHAISHKKGAITFFAAANNDGSNSGEMFPANLSDHVIPVRATNIEGGLKARYNPPLSSDGVVFGTLGVDVVSDWPGMDVGKQMSGCSVATPVAVTIAAVLLEYAASKPLQFTDEDLRLMRTRRGVYEIFKEIGIDAGNRRYYVAPFDFMRLGDDVIIGRLKSALGRHPESKA